MTEPDRLEMRESDVHRTVDNACARDRIEAFHQALSFLSRSLYPVPVPFSLQIFSFREKKDKKKGKKREREKIRG